VQGFEHSSLPNGSFFDEATHYFYGGTFFRRGGEPPLSHFRVSNPYVNPYNELLLSFVRDQVEGFFNNPSLIRTIGGDVWVFSDVNAVVRYHDTHVLEYTSYRAVDRSAPSRFVDNFAVAASFVARDALVVNEAYLAGYSEEGNGRHVFYFNFVAGNKPLILEESPVKVTVEHGTVMHYQRTAYQFFWDEGV
jgi:hypothetical protein